MEWVERLNQSMNYIEEHLTGEIDYANAPDIEVYLNPDSQNAQYEVWIPVAKKKE